MRHIAFRFIAIILSFLFLSQIMESASAECASIAEQATFPSMYCDQAIFANAINKERPHSSSKLSVTGITVPHHLLAADLIARGFWAASGDEFDRIIVLSPDHFKRSHKAFATTRMSFDTVFGTISNDEEASNSLLKHVDLFDDSNLFAKEHGIAAILPFARQFFPQSKIVAVAISVFANQTDWDNAVQALEPLVDGRTLVIQSTDFSHYLTASVAAQRDQETLNIIAADDYGAILHLKQPDHMDSKGGQYIQMKLQAHKNSNATVVANRNSTEYGPAGSKTTSYIVTVYRNSNLTSPLFYEDQSVAYFGGDAFIGRWLNQPLSNSQTSQEIADEVLRLTGGQPLILNLEGVVQDDAPENVKDNIHLMYSSLALPLLQKMNVVAVSLANNHSFDLGSAALKQSISILQRSGIKPVLQEQVVNVGPFRLLALNFIGPGNARGYPFISKDRLKDICNIPAQPPIFAFVHWGREYTNSTGSSEYKSSELLHNCGISAIIGAHSHQAAEKIESMQGGAYQLTYSLGNFLFDQTTPRSSAALVEVRIFGQGTFASRLIPMKNLFELANKSLERITSH
jgi:AmmeMemoRadiSam system protein B